MRHTRRYKNGKYRENRFWNKNRKVWLEVMCFVNLAVWGGGVAVDIFPVAEAYYSIPDKIEIFNRMPNGIPSYEAKTMGNYDESVATSSRTTTDSESIATKEEGQEPIQALPPSSIEAKILKAFEDTNAGDVAVAIAKSESGLNPNAVGDIPLEYEYEGRTIGHSCGIFQIRVLPSRPNCEELKDIDTNIRFARKLYDSSGFQPWSNFKNGRFQKFLK